MNSLFELLMSSRDIIGTNSRAGELRVRNISHIPPGTIMDHSASGPEERAGLLSTVLKKCIHFLTAI